MNYESAPQLLNRFKAFNRMLDLGAQISPFTQESAEDIHVSYIMLVPHLKECPDLAECKFGLL